MAEEATAVVVVADPGEVVGKPQSITAGLRRQGLQVADLIVLHSGTGFQEQVMEGPLPRCQLNIYITFASVLPSGLLLYALGANSSAVLVRVGGSSCLLGTRENIMTKMWNI